MIVDFLFFAFAAGAVISALLMVTRSNPVASAIFLIGVLFNLSGLFLLLEAQFVAVLNVILYAGAIMVLFLFVIMLLNLGHADWADLRGPAGALIVGSISVAFLALTTRFLFAGGGGLVADEADPALAAAVEADGVIGALARPLFESYTVPFEVTGLLLLVAMVGTILLARKESP